ncbi:glutamine-hydrolysing GMP synthase [Candidatus Kinetoplastibacterium oncopeltii TCC290E]|uniref:GMP synthase [glutamine-hydrolyzing] n=1 Tax=Candidatus Kinetoplastidibacterium stringomonadis TCC290E TaxID=1208920 RepID=M1LS27_9PROT|nr:glutamine-hydrolyzing GMP synthase [Candidatus Kinetoplastibacterium oncopeltii]AGF48342.1 glutamine-hydrolysing GMP synthase [Candidatus Kinetoplastibacterium oncopeltii TCC290E]
MNQHILVIDNGSQVTQLIARRIREIGVYTEVEPNDISEKTIQKHISRGLKGIILSGSFASASEENLKLKLPSSIFCLGIPVLGICYGMQAMAMELGGMVSSLENREFGYTEVINCENSQLLGNINDFSTDNKEKILRVWMSHADTVTSLPKGFKKISYSKITSAIAGMENVDRKLYALQFHPEVTHTIQGYEILKRFVVDICECNLKWNMPDYVCKSIDEIKSSIGKDKVILGLSGGVDSSVAAILIHKAIKDQLTCIFVDNGLMRLEELNQVKKMFSDKMKMNIIYVDSSETFIKKLAGVTDPEMKRKIIGNEFINIFQQEANKIKDVCWLAQGTIYPDIIESSHGKKVIKSHHNVGGLPEKMSLKLLEPLKHLFKDEVRKLGKELGLDDEMLFRHPFPGPGLGVRIIGEIKPEFLILLKKADNIFIEELKNNINKETNKQWYYSVSQAFAVFLPIKSVGVMGDNRTYEYVIALRAIKTNDFMTADWFHLPFDLLSKISSRIINEVKGINRVVYDISNKPPATVEWE